LSNLSRLTILSARATEGAHEKKTGVMILSIYHTQETGIDPKAV